jgi:hypothetical protein
MSETPAGTSPATASVDDIVGEMTAAASLKVGVTTGPEADAVVGGSSIRELLGDETRRSR